MLYSAEIELKWCRVLENGVGCYKRRSVCLHTGCSVRVKRCLFCKTDIQKKTTDGRLMLSPSCYSVALSRTDAHIGQITKSNHGIRKAILQLSYHWTIGWTNRTITLTLKTLELLHIGNLSEKRLLTAATPPNKQTIESYFSMCTVVNKESSDFAWVFWLRTDAMAADSRSKGPV